MTRVTLDLPDDLHHKLAGLAAQFGMSMKEFIVASAIDGTRRTDSAQSGDAAEGDSGLNDLVPHSPFRLSEQEWDSLHQALEAPPKPSHRLKALLSICDQPSNCS
ncbi:MAG: DUF1778 domain-containing protein [Verrucomicrobiales bacterium]